MRDHLKLRAFQLADELVFSIYKTTHNFPKDEVFGLTSQIRRAGVSVASNIVEGCAHESEMDYHRFLDMAFGSLKEMHYPFGLAVRLGYCNEKDSVSYELKFVETEKVLGSLVRTFRKRK